MNFGIIGTGSIAKTHAQAITAMVGSTIVGAFNRSPDKAATFAEEHKTRAFSSLDELLADPDLEIVTIATPSGAHFDPAMAAIAAGKHVLIEKPLEITTDRIDALSTAADAKGVILAGILNRRFSPAMDAAKKAAEANRFGKLTSASAYIKWYRDQAYYDSAAWRGTWKLDGGGALMNQGIHAIDSLLYLAGPVVSVQANTACLAHENIEVEDIAVAIIEFQNGARGVVEGTTCTWSKNGHPGRIQLSGTKGSVFIADEALEIWDFMDETEADLELIQKRGKSSGIGQGANDPKAIQFLQHQRNFEEVVTAIQEKRLPTTSASEARKSVELIQAIYKSAQNNGQKILL